jgi:hypothetical protein
LAETVYSTREERKAMVSTVTPNYRISNFAGFDKQLADLRQVQNIASSSRGAYRIPGPLTFRRTT